MPIWKFTFAMMAMHLYMGTPLIFMVPDGVVMVVDVKGK